MLKHSFFFVHLGWRHYQGVCLWHPQPATNIAGQQEGQCHNVKEIQVSYLYFSEKPEKYERKDWKYILHLWGCHRDLPRSSEPTMQTMWVPTNGPVRAKDADSVSDKTPWSEIKVSEQTNLPNLKTLMFLFVLDRWNHTNQHLLSLRKVYSQVLNNMELPLRRPVHILKIIAMKPWPFNISSLYNSW